MLDTKAKGQEQLIAELKERNQERLTLLIQRFENERNALMDKSEKENNLNSLMQELHDDLQSKGHQIVSLTESLRDADQKLKDEQHTFRKERERLEKKVTELSEQLERVRQDYTNESSKHLEVLTDLKHEQNTSKAYLQQITDLKSDNAHLRSQAETLTSAITEFASKKATAAEGELTYKSAIMHFWLSYCWLGSKTIKTPVYTLLAVFLATFGWAHEKWLDEVLAIR